MSFKTNSVKSVEYSSGCRLWLAQWRALVRKLLLVLRKSPLMLTLAILGPAICMVLASATSKAITNNVMSLFDSHNQDATLLHKTELPECDGSIGCKPIYYYAPKDPYHMSIMDSFAHITSLKMETDIIGFNSHSEMFDAFYDNNWQLKRHMAALTIAFNTFEDDRAPSSQNDATARLTTLKTTAYTIGAIDKWSADGVFPSGYLIHQGIVITTKAALDKSIIAARIMQKNDKGSTNDNKTLSSLQHIPFIDISLAALPRVLEQKSVRPGVESSETLDDDTLKTKEHSKMEVQKSAGSLFTTTIMCIGFLPMLLLLSQALGYEKHNRLIGVLRKLSMFESAYWASVGTVIVILGFVSSIFCVIAGAAIGSSFAPYGNINLFIIFLLQLLFAMSFCSFGLLCVAAISQPYATNIFRMALIAVTLLGIIVFDAFSSFGLHQSETPFQSSWIAIYAVSWKACLLSLLPSFHYGRIMREITWGTSQYNLKGYYDLSNATITLGPFRHYSGFIYYPEDPNESPYAPFKEYYAPPAWFNLFIMAMLFLGYLVVCWYMNQIVVGNNGRAQNIFFFLMPSYWRSNKHIDHHDERVVVQDLTKRFGKVNAVDRVSMTMRKGRCLALLGHNGAGKSTLINMLSGLTRPTSGDALILGHKLSDGISAVQRDLGTCPQDDIHYPVLSAREHLRLYARFKGIHSEKVLAYVEERLSIVGLLGHADQMVGEYSGGMKRRLSIVSAGIGEPKFVILDEPTAGMDPINRRKVWEYIAKMKRDCVLLLTSHSMEETDALGDEICILDHGEVKATGTPLELKNLHGTGYQINLLTWPEKHASLCAFVTETLPQAIISASSATSLSVVVKRDETMRLAEFLTILQNTMRLPEQQRQVRDWGIQNASLEQVFMKFSKNAQADLIENDDKLDGSILDVDTALEPLVVSFKAPTQIWAVALKNFAFQKRQRKTNVVILLIIGCLLGAMHCLLSLMSTSKRICPEGHLEFVLNHSNHFKPLDAKKALPEDFEETCDISKVKEFQIASNTQCRPSASFLCDISDYGAHKQVEYVNNSTVEIWVKGTEDEMIRTMRGQNATVFFQKSASLAKLSKLLGTPITEASLIRPVNFRRGNADIPTMLRGAQEVLKRDAKNSTDKCPNAMRPGPVVESLAIAEKQLREKFPDVALSFSKTPVSDLSQNFSAEIHYYARLHVYNSHGYPFAHYLIPIKSEDGYIRCEELGLPFMDARTRAKDRDKTAPMPLLNEVRQFGPNRYSHQEDSLIRHMIGSIMNSYARTLVDPDETILADYTKLYHLEYPTHIEMVATAFVLLVIYWLFPIYVFIPFMEREQQLYNYYKVNGLMTTTYLLGNYIFNLLFSLPVLIIVVVLAKLYFSAANVGLLLLAVSLGIHSTIGMAFLYASVMRSPVTARLMAFLVPILFTLIAVLLVFADVVGGTALTSSWGCLFPPIALAISLRIIMQNSGLSLVIGPLLMLFFVGVFCIALAVLLTNVPEQLRRVSEYFRCLFRARSKRNDQLKKTEDEIEMLDSYSENIDPEILEEIQRVDSMKGNDQLAVKIQHLSKYYGKFAAVNNLTLGIEMGECFGLLGPNGSGKTTTVSMLSGLIIPSSGSAMVGDLNIVDPHMPSMLGMCPQHDCVVLELTVEENLMFFARLRGASTQQARLHANHAATTVGLNGAAYKRQAEKLSGGMRRRLSIAIALIGLPPVIILDEPTTGLDPGNRMEIWRVISRIRDSKKHGIILISHIMEEVDSLTSRMGIMAAGSLRCLGNQVSLKNRFASGYTLYLQIFVECFNIPEHADVLELTLMETSHIDAVTQFVRENASEQAVLHQNITANLTDRLATGEILYDAAEQKTTWMISLRYSLPGDVHLGQLFYDMERKAHEINVVEWSLNQNSLEDVFVQVAGAYVK